MTFKEVKNKIKEWRFTKYKGINLLFGITALLLYEFFARPVYRPWVYKNKINDFHIADTLGNTLGAATTIFILIFIFANEAKKGQYLIILGTISVIVFEICHPLLGKPIDIWDIIASIVTGLICYCLHKIIFKRFSQNT